MKYAKQTLLLRSGPDNSQFVTAPGNSSPLTAAGQTFPCTAMTDMPQSGAPALRSHYAVRQLLWRRSLGVGRAQSAYILLR
jgi:hypothetical protein